MAYRLRLTNPTLKNTISHIVTSEEECHNIIILVVGTPACRDLCKTFDKVDHKTRRSATL